MLAYQEAFRAWFPTRPITGQWSSSRRTCSALRVGTGPPIPRYGQHSSEAGGGAAGAFDQLGEEQGAGLALAGLTGETKPD